MKLDGTHVLIYPHYPTPLTAAGQDRHIYTDALRHNLRCGIYHPAVIKFWWQLIKTWRTERRGWASQIGKTARERERDVSWGKRRMTGQTRMMTDDLMKNWLAGRKENQLEDTTENMGREKRERERDRKGKWEGRWMKIGKRRIKTAIERISENNGEMGGEIEKYEHRKRATVTTEVERCR